MKDVFTDVDYSDLKEYIRVWIGYIQSKLTIHKGATAARYQTPEARNERHTTNTLVHLARGKRLTVLASIARPLADLLRLITRIITLILHTDLLDVGDAGAAVDGSRVAQVAVDPDEGLARVRDDVPDGHGASLLLVAVAAGPVSLPNS